MGQISSSLLQKAFVTWQHAFLSTSILFYDISAEACEEIQVFGQKSDLAIIGKIVSSCGSWA